MAVRLARLRQPLAARLAALPPRYQELIQDTGLGVALATVNVVSLLPYRDQLHPLWLALVLAAGQALPLAFRRFRPVGVALVIGAARVAYDKIGFGFAPFPLGPAIAFYTIIDRRGTFWRWVARSRPPCSSARLRSRRTWATCWPSSACGTGCRP